MVADWAHAHDVIEVAYTPAWGKGLKAGPERNRAMLEHGRPEVLIALPGGKGTRSCVEAARSLGIPVLCVDWVGA